MGNIAELERVKGNPERVNPEPGKAYSLSNENHEVYSVLVQK